MRQAIAAMVVLAGMLAGCGGVDRRSVDHLRQGEYQDLADRAMAQAASAKDRSDRDYVRTRMRLFYARQIDGQTPANDLTMQELFDILAAQGINRSKAVTSVVVNENVKIWKGEPFEQAMGFYYIGLHNAMLDSWDNALAAGKNALFHLRDYRQGADEVVTPVDLVNRAAESDVAAQAEGDAEADYLEDEDAYRVVPSPFALGHLLVGLASEQLAEQWGDENRRIEADDSYARALQADPQLEPVVAALRSGQCNVLLFVDYGQGPAKTRTGPDGAIALFAPVVPSDAQPLQVTLGPGEPLALPQACDLNAMATDHMWNNLEDVRVAKSYIGTALLASGVALAATTEDEGAMWAGMGLAAAGIYMRATAGADTRYCEALPQRVYVVPLRLPRGGADVTLTLDTPAGASRLVLDAVQPPAKGELLVRHVRLLPATTQKPWLTHTETYYYSQAGPPTASDRLCLPYILGGHCVRPPSEAVLAEYQRAGFLTDFTLEELEELYRLEGIDTTDSPPAWLSQRHLLEGGQCLALPEPATMGRCRLLRQEHRPYRPRSDVVEALMEQYRARLSPAPLAQAERN